MLSVAMGHTARVHAVAGTAACEQQQLLHAFAPALNKPDPAHVLAREPLPCRFVHAAAGAGATAAA